MTSSNDSIQPIIEQLKNGDDLAAEKIWNRYFPQLVQVARQRLRGQRAAMADEEDVPLSALDSFMDAAKNGRFPDLKASIISTPPLPGVGRGGVSFADD